MLSPGEDKGEDRVEMTRLRVEVRPRPLTSTSDLILTLILTFAQWASWLGLPLSGSQAGTGTFPAPPGDLRSPYSFTALSLALR